MGFVRSVGGDGYAVRAFPNDGFVGIEIDQLVGHEPPTTLAKLDLRETDLELLPLTVDRQDYVLAIWALSARYATSDYEALLSRDGGVVSDIASYSGPRVRMNLASRDGANELVNANGDNEIVPATWGRVKGIYR